MNRQLYCRIVIFSICICLLPVNVPAKADDLQKAAVVVIAGVAVIGAAIGIGIYYAFNHGHSIKGCAVDGPNGLELRNESDQQTFQLVGITTDVKPGDRVKVTGKKKKLAKGSTANPNFLVDKLSKDYGACVATTAKP